MVRVGLDDLRSWPQALIKLLDQNRALAREFCADGLSYKVQKLSHFPELFKPYLPLTEHIEEILGNCTIQGFHSTRLTDIEIKSIKTEGLKLPTYEFLSRKIEKLPCLDSLTKQGMLSTIGAEEKRHEINDPCIYFCLSKRLLSNASATHRFFRNWGGEIIYHQIEGNNNFKDALQIGKPAIIVANLRPSLIRTRNDIVTMVIRRYVEYLEPFGDPEVFECWLRQDMPPHEIEGILRFGELRFACLTNYTEEVP